MSTSTTLTSTGGQDPLAEALDPAVAPQTPHPARGADARRGPVGWLTRLGRNWGTVLSLIVLAVVLGWAVVPGLFAPGDPLTGVPQDNLQAPSWAHPFGTDYLGRDVFTRSVHGTSRTLVTAGLAVGLGVVAGTLLGLLAGTCGRLVDAIAMRLADVLLAIPAVLIALVIVTAYEPGPLSLGIGVGLASVATFARLTRSEVMRVRSTEFVEAARLAGARGFHVVVGHILPHVLGPVLALLVVELGTAILAIAGLGFLGFGAPPPAPEWGLLVSEGRQYISRAWWMSTLPGVVIAVTVLSLAAAGRALQRKVRI